MMVLSTNRILEKSLNLEPITLEEGLFLFENAPLNELIFVGNQLRTIHVPGNKVTWQIDRNVNITNVCVAGCKFCNFHCGLRDGNAYITTLDEYRAKIREMFSFGGEQLLLQGGLHPKLGLDFYTQLFRAIKEEFPNVKLHALGPPEIAHIAKIEKLNYREVLVKLMESGLDSLPGGGAEILVDRVRKLLSPGKPDSQAWLDVMAEAHQLGLLTTATMMFGHIETPAERIEHLIKYRELQSRKPNNSVGFSAFIPWPFQDKGTELEKMGVKNTTTAAEYIRMIALSRIILNNITHIQASWLTVGIETAQLCLHAGADDLGSIMIEENVVSSAGSFNKMDAYGIQKAISEAGFEPQLRNQAYEYIPFPEVDFEKMINASNQKNNLE
ncbi:MAG TPA: cyclic dehypoxanthinyl futalosine synthase [Tenuifilaceae bacterium]|nr:cyclic dehypoxanthinyl futalosine synthase [Tenuifilaceae bacterium]HRX67852.1 cyclic dehypoxanthinyl futalosine synthase [Tenuifilaceae bacterium]